MASHLTHDTARAPHTAAQILHSSALLLRNRIFLPYAPTRSHQRVNGINGKSNATDESGDGYPGGKLVVTYGGLGQFKRDSEDGVTDDEGQDYLKRIFCGGVGGGTAEPVQS